ncbi:MAG: 50S ribosomal protein L5 [Candidatus Thermoplasmatota archaeon]
MAKKNNKKKKAKRKTIFSPEIEKVTVNIGVGEAGEKLRKAEKVIQKVTKQKPVRTLSKINNKELGVRKGLPIGCKVTLRDKKAENFLKKALETRNKKIADYSFDDQGNVSFGVPDYTLFEDQKYDPEIGIFGLDVCVTMKRPGYRIKKRRIQKKKIPERHQIKPEDTMKYFSEELDVEVI